jgi:hypothetical protein
MIADHEQHSTAAQAKHGPMRAIGRLAQRIKKAYPDADKSEFAKQEAG